MPMKTIVAPVPQDDSQDQGSGLEFGISAAFEGDIELSNGIATAGVNLASDISGAAGNFFYAMQTTLMNNPRIITYTVYALGAYAALSAYNKFVRSDR
jgi:hypothetical protein